MNARTRIQPDANAGGEHRPNYAVPPGANILDAISERGLKQVDVAARLGIHASVLSEFIHGKRSITPETARSLELVLGIPMAFWLKAEARYREHQARIAEAHRYAEWVPWAKRFPLIDMMNQGWLPRIPAKDSIGRVRALLTFLRVASPDSWDASYKRLKIAYRKTEAIPADSFHLGAWLQQGENQAQRLQVRPYDEDAFKHALTKARGLAGEPGEVPLVHVQQLLRECGVRLEYVPALPKSRAAGATRWLDSTSPLIQLSLRGKTDDLYWFTLFHETAHVLKHGHSEVLAALDDAEDQRELEANEWAANHLIPANAWQEFIHRGVFSLGRIQQFAAEVNMAPGVVVGRLQKEGLLDKTTGNRLKRSVDFPVASQPVALLDPDEQATQWMEALGAY
jgi:HTH-type transcriptional regulator/antitoxin HigA